MARYSIPRNVVLKVEGGWAVQYPETGMWLKSNGFYYDADGAKVFKHRWRAVLNALYWDWLRKRTWQTDIV